MHGTQDRMAEEGRSSMMNKRLLVILILMFSMVLPAAACGQNQGYEQISVEEAKQIMDTEENYVILDVRTEEEYFLGHIPGAVLIPDYEIGDRAEAELKDKDQLILVYCRSGNRSKNASAELAEMGYTNVKEFGGINDWPYQQTR